MRRGEIRIVDFEPALGSESDKRRPAILVSNDASNATAERTGRGVVTVVPLTSNTLRVLPFQVLVTDSESGLRQPSKAQAEQVRSVATERIGALLGRVRRSTLQQVDEALRLHLDL